MKLVYIGNLAAILAFLLFIVIFFSTCAGEEYLFHQTRFLVRIPPPVDRRADEQEKFWQFQKILFPRQEAPDPISEGLSNSDALLIISFEKDQSIKINSENCGSLFDLEPSKKRLREIFQYREKNAVIDRENHKPIKAVMIKAPLSAKYGEVEKIIDALKENGADPIVLQIDCLPE